MPSLPILVDEYFTALFGGLPGGSGLSEGFGGIHQVKDKDIQGGAIRDDAGRFIAPLSAPLTGPDDVDALVR